MKIYIDTKKEKMFFYEADAKITIPLILDKEFEFEVDEYDNPYINGEKVLMEKN